ncbi:MAG: MinD/ParA family ATP-binding protein [Bacteriovoracaceae bacterium]
MKQVSDWLQSFRSEDILEALIPSSKTNTALPKRTAALHKARTVSITGGKGGVGKTSVAIKTARELAELGFKVLLIDCDYNLANTAIKLNLPLNDAFYSLLSAEKTLEECLYSEGNFHLLSGCNGSLELFENKLPLDQVIMDIMGSHEHEYDYMLLDCPAGLSKETLTLNAYCDERFFIVTPDKSSITDSYSLMKVLATKYGVKENHLIINMYSSEEQFNRVVNSIVSTAENYLGVRTQILGGIKKLEVKVDSFDDHFLRKKSSVNHEDFLKVIKRYAEKREVTQHDVGSIN